MITKFFFFNIESIVLNFLFFISNKVLLNFILNFNKVLLKFHKIKRAVYKIKEDGSK